MRVKGISNIDNNNTQMNTYKSKERGKEKLETREDCCRHKHVCRYVSIDVRYVCR